MKDIVDINVTQVRVYSTDALPYSDLRQSTNIKTLKASFNFENVQADPLGLQLGFSNGTFEFEGRPIHVLSLTFEPRRIITQIRGKSSEANAVYAALVELLKSLLPPPRIDNLKTLMLAEETNCVGTLDIDFDELIAPTLLKFIQKEGKAKLQTDYGIPKKIAFKSLSFEVKYELKNSELEEHDVALSSKLIKVEPRVGTPMRERRFFTSSPTDSETHLAILEALERLVRNARAGDVS